jgi:hypothetical protein
VGVKYGEAKRKCGFVTYKENVLDKFVCPLGWTMFTRPYEYTREVLVMAHPDMVKNGTVPHGNDRMVQLPKFWSAIKECAGSLETVHAKCITHVVINFGHWEHAMRADPFLVECHAHAHLWLTPEFVHACKSLERHDYPPEDYVLENASLLERERLFYHRVDSLTGMKQDMDGMKQDMDGMKQDMDGMKQDIKVIKDILLARR